MKLVIIDGEEARFIEKVQIKDIWVTPIMSLDGEDVEFYKKEVTFEWTEKGAKKCKKCKKCGGEVVVKIYKNRAGGRQQGLYCSKCGKYYKFLTNAEVFECVKEGYKLCNTYGDLSNTALKRNLKARG